ncbi:hypothetical protein EDD11_003566 [Mortierella claussenii]|nr:hypothetical protein EDD11_003566 [Mortierella claussenii]
MTPELMQHRKSDSRPHDTLSSSSIAATTTAAFVTSRSPSSSSMHSTRSTMVTKLRHRQLVQPISPTDLECTTPESGQIEEANSGTDRSTGEAAMRYPRVWLSSLDLTKPRIYTRLLYFFDASSSRSSTASALKSALSPSSSATGFGSSSLASSSTSSPSTGPHKKSGSKSRHHYHHHQSPFMDPMLLQASLALVLTDYFPLAGRLYSSKDKSHFTASGPSTTANSSDAEGQYIECNDRGVLFAVADTMLTMAQIRSGDYQDAVLPPQLFPVGLYPASLRDPPLLGIQLTYTQDQSLIMGVAADSSVMDATSLVSFMDAWAKITQGKDFSPYPVLNRNFLEKYGRDFAGGTGVYRHQRINNSPPPPIFDNHLSDDGLIDRGLGDADLHTDDDDGDEEDQEGENNPEQSNIEGSGREDGLRDSNVEEAQRRMQLLNVSSEERKTTIPTVVIDRVELVLEPPMEDLPDTAAIELEGSSLHLFHFSYEQLQRIKKLASEQNIAAAACAADDKEISDKWVSTGDSLIAYLWKMSTITRRMEPDCKLMCGVVMDIRNRVAPAVPEGFIGNAILSISVQMPVHSLLTTPLSLPSRLLRDELMLQTPEQIQSAISWIQKQRHPHLIETDSNNPFGHDFMVWSFRKLNLYSPDFGQGPPCKVRCGRGGFGGGEGMCIIMDSAPLDEAGGVGTSRPGGSSEPGVDVYLGLQGEHLQDFEKIHRGFMEGLLEPSGSHDSSWELV